MIESKTSINESGNFECKVEMSIDDLAELADCVKYNIIEKVSDELAKSIKDYVHNSIDWSDIVPKVQQSIVNTLMIKEMRETLQERGKIG